MDTVKKTYCKGTMLVISLLLAVTLSSPAIADVTYTGNAFNTFTGGATSPPYTYISGSFTEATALAANTTYPWPASGNPPSYSFSDGVHSLTSANSQVQYFYLVTNSAGNISSWGIA